MTWKMWKENREELVAQGESTIAQLQEAISESQKTGATNGLGKEVVTKCYEQISK